MKYYRDYSTCWKYIISDYQRYGKHASFLSILIEVLIVRNHSFVYTFWFRLCKVKGFLYPFSRYKHWRLSKKYGIQIPVTTQIGYGFYIGHGVGLIINSLAVIGNNVNLSQFTTIGGHGKAAVIGDNVYVGPSVCIVNDVYISDNVTIGAGTVVVKDLPKNATVAGVPARILNFDNPGRFVENRWEAN